MGKIWHAHDKFFKGVLSHTSVAKAMLKQHLPEAILNRIDLDSIEPTKGNFIEPEYREVISDVLFKAKIDGQEGYAYLLLEHQSSPDKMMPLRLMRYMVNIMLDHTKNENNKTTDSDILPPVIPLVFYAGDKKYHYPTNFFDLFGTQKAFMEEVILKGFRFYDFNSISDEQIRKYSKASVVLIAQTIKHIHNPKLLEIFEFIWPLFRQLETEEGPECLLHILQYAGEEGIIESRDRFIQFLKRVASPEVGERVMSLAHQWQEEGRQEGEKLGIVKGEKSAKLVIARNLLKQGLPVNQVVQATGLPASQVKQLKEERF